MTGEVVGEIVGNDVDGEVVGDAVGIELVGEKVRSTSGKQRKC